MVAKFILAALLVITTLPAIGQPTHPAVGDPHWYDIDCCGLNDCRPFTIGELFWTPEGFVVRRRFLNDGRTEVTCPPELIRFNDGRIRGSLDAAVHGCWLGISCKARCIYISSGT